MFSFLRKKNKDIKKVAEEQLQKHIEVLQSLKDYDSGKKDISTSDIERHLPNIRLATHG